MTKKFTALLLSALLLLALPVAAHAAGTELHVVGPAEAPAVGERFEVSVEISGNPGIVGVRLALAYDQAKLRCTSITEGKAVSDMGIVIPNKGAKDGAMIAAAASEPVGDDGVIAVFAFEVLQAGAEVPRTLPIAELSLLGGGRQPYTLVQKTADGGAVETPDDGGSDGTTPVEVPDFPDVKAHWGKEYVEKAAALGLFTGYEDGTFRPDNLVTRGQFVTVLWRMAGKPAPTKANPFTDVPADAWYADAVVWAFEKGYVSGRSAEIFDPEGTITRQEAMKILFAYAGGKSGLELLLTSDYDSAFTDSGDIAAWAKSAMYWGVYNGLIKGKGEGLLAPTDYATRAELAKILVTYAAQ